MYFKYDRESVDEDFAAWHSVLIQCLDRQAPIKHKRVKSSYLPVWYVPEIGEASKLRDKFKRLNEWPEYKNYGNLTKNLIRNAKCKYFADSVESSKNTSTIWKHLSAVNKRSTSKANSIPDELIINNEHILAQSHLNYMNIFHQLLKS